MTNLLTLDHHLNPTSATCRAIVETPQSSRSKFDYDEETGLFRLAAVLPAGMAFPLSFGFVPGTKAEYGDPVDILVLSDEVLASGTLVEVRLLGAIDAEQTEEGKTVRNDRLIGKIAKSHTWGDIQEVAQLGRAFADDLARFFETYNALRNRSFCMKALAGRDAACSLIALSPVS